MTIGPVVPRTRRSRMRQHVSRLLKAGGVRRFVTTLVPTATALVIQFAAFALTARGLGVATFGEYAAILGLATIGVELVGLGGADLLVRAVARDATRFAAYFGNMLLLSALTLPLVVLGMTWVALGPMGTSIAPLYVLLGLAGEILIGRVSASVELTMVAHGQTARAACVRLVTAGTRLVAAAGYFLVAHTLKGWIAVVLGQSLALSLVLLLIARRLYGLPQFAIRRGEMLSGGAFAINQVSRAMQGNIDRVILGRFAEASVLGTYAAGSRILTIGLFPLQVMTRLFYPTFFREGEKGLAATRAYALRCLPAMAGMGLLSSVAVAVIAQFVPKVLGRDFAGSTHTAVLLGLSLPLISMQYLAADTLTGAGYQHIRAIIFGVAGVGFGLVLVLGARLAGTDGMIAAYLIAHGILMTVLWTVAFLKKDNRKR